MKLSQPGSLFDSQFEHIELFAENFVHWNLRITVE